MPENMIINYISLLTLIILWSTILTSAEAQDTYDKCKNAMTEFRGACRNLSGFTTTMKMRDKAASVHILKNLTKLIQPLEPGPINLSIWSSRTANIECNEPLPYQIEFIIVIVMERYGALDLYICLDNVVTLIKRDIDTDFTANCICAHVWSCKYSVAPDGLCRLFNNCSCQNTRDVLHTAVINRPPQMLASFTQSRCPPADCCMTDQAAEWTSWTVCTEPTIDHEFLEQSRYRAVRVKDHEPVCKNEQEIRSCLTTTTPTETPIISIASDENFPQQQPVEEEINKIKKAQASVSSSSSGMVIGISVAAAVVALLTIGAAMLILAICRKKNKAVDEKNAEAGRKTDSRLERNSLAADFSRSNMRPAIRSTMDKNAKSSTKTRSKSKLTLPAPISAEDRQHYVALTPRKRTTAE